MSDIRKKLRSYNPTSGYSKTMRIAADIIDHQETRLTDNQYQIKDLKQKLEKCKVVLNRLSDLTYSFDSRKRMEEMRAVLLKDLKYD